VPLPSLSEKQVLYFLIQFIVLVLSARSLADLMRRLGQATVIGELMAGLVLGPSILGKFPPGVERLIFPPDPIMGHRRWTHSSVHQVRTLGFRWAGLGTVASVRHRRDN
jgi:hypothetical protein